MKTPRRRRAGGREDCDARLAVRRGLRPLQWMGADDMRYKHLIMRSLNFLGLNLFDSNDAATHHSGFHWMPSAYLHLDGMSHLWLLGSTGQFLACTVVALHRAQNFGTGTQTYPEPQIVGCRPQIRADRKQARGMHSSYRRSYKTFSALSSFDE